MRQSVIGVGGDGQWSEGSGFRGELSAIAENPTRVLRKRNPQSDGIKQLEVCHPCTCVGN